MQRVDVFDPALTNEKQNEQTLLFSRSSTNTRILRSISILIPVISSNIRTLEARYSA
jgi:hypothetical protein